MLNDPLRPANLHPRFRCRSVFFIISASEASYQFKLQICSLSDACAYKYVFLLNFSSPFNNISVI